MVNFCSYNIRGANKKPKQASVHDFLLDNKISFVGLIETRVKERHAKFVSASIHNKWRWEFNYEFHNNGRIWVGWDPNVWDVSILSKSEQMIHCSVYSPELNLQFFTSIIYALHTPVERRALWGDLLTISGGMLAPWCILGDFNETKSLDEVDGNSNSWDYGNIEFKSCLESISVEDLRATGAFHTWWNSQDHSPTYKKLDRILVNDHWLLQYGNSEAIFGNRGLSDHCPAILKTGFVFSHIHKPFQFFNYMMSIDGFSEELKNAWDCHVAGDPLFVLSEKLRIAKKAIISLNKKVGNLSAGVTLARNLLNEVQSKLLINPRDSSLLKLQREYSSNLWDAMQREEALFKQKSRIQWLKEGDSNSSYFHSKVKANWNSNKILSIENDDGILVSGHDKVKHVAVGYFSNLLGTNQPSSSSGLMDFRHLFSKTLTHVQARALDLEVVDEEIIKTLRRMKKNKSPGPDGFNVAFFLHNWNIVGHDFLNAIKSFFSRGCLLSGTNSTAIALIPKVPNPSNMGDYRPISCCNTTYKCISKIIADRLKLTLDFLISRTQAAFVSGRSIGDNILIAQELMRNYHRKKGPSRCTLKIDLRKAFDSIKWNFIFDMLHLFQFPPKFIYWIRACITTPRFSIKVNGALCGYFKGTQGLRQGDPLSPYLFVLAMETLSLIISDRIKGSRFKFHWRTQECNITNICFADDLMLFCHGDPCSVGILKECLNLFSSLSGLNPNPDKSQCFLANVSEDDSRAILDILGFELGILPAKFLGVPLISSKLSRSDCLPLIEKITLRISSWTSKFLSFSGRIQLVRSVVFAIQAYWSSFFILPSAVLKDIQSIFCRFIWKGPSLQKYGSKVAWQKLALPFSEGGLNIKQVTDWNRALILVHLWNVINPASNSLWARWIRNTVIKDKHFWCLPIPSDCSWIWRKVLKLRSIAIDHIQFMVGDGDRISLWFDPWLHHRPLALTDGDPLISNSGLGPNAKVSGIINSSGWILPSSNHMTMYAFRESFDFSRPLNCGHQDKIMWDSAETVKGRIIWNSIRHARQEVDWWKIVWHKLKVPRFSFYLWLAFHKGFKTRDVLASYGLGTPTDCCLCNAAPESFNHLFFQCGYSFQLLFVVFRFCGWRGSNRSWHSITHYILQLDVSKLQFNIISLGLAAIVYHIWRERNARVHGEPGKPSSCLSREIIHLIKCRLHSYNMFRRKASNPLFRHFSMFQIE